MRSRILPVAVFLSLALSACTPAKLDCGGNGSAMSITQMFFGRDIYGKGEVSDADWANFVRDTIIPRFPDGFTVLDAAGQYLDTSRNVAISEKSKIVIIAAGDDPDTRASVAGIASEYKTRFNQQSVGIIRRSACASF
jgi:hypothetical protein